MKRRAKVTGFTLIEMLLVLIIVSMIIYMGLGYLQQRTVQIRMDRTSLQMQQILNAGMAYYIANSTWPANLACLQGVGGGAMRDKIFTCYRDQPLERGCLHD